MDSATLKIRRETIGEVMTKDVVALKINDTLRLADDMMNLAHLRHFPVLDEGRVVGIVNHDDLLHASMASLSRHPQDAPRSALGTVADEAADSKTAGNFDSRRRRAHGRKRHRQRADAAGGDSRRRRH